MKFSLYCSSLVLAVIFILLGANSASAQYGSSCSEYGIMAYESGGYCKCMSGYVMSDNMFGGSSCISADQACKDEFGYGAKSNYSGSCECRYGYTWGEDMYGDTSCIDENQACRDQLGYNSSASLGGGCECNYGYIIDGGECKSGNTVCQRDHGYHASYDNLSNRCECDTDYTFDGNYQCVEKQNNVYFKLLDTNLDESEILIKSEYDYRNYIVRYGVGCFDSSISSYEGSNLVVNLGTDYSVDMFDTIVLQNHSQTCPIMYKEQTSDDSFPEEVEEEIYYYNPPSQNWTPTTVNSLTQTSLNPVTDLMATPEERVPEPLSQNTTETAVASSSGETTSSTPTVATSTETPKEEPEKKESFFSRIINFFKNLF